MPLFCGKKRQQAYVSVFYLLVIEKNCGNRPQSDYIPLVLASTLSSYLFPKDQYVSVFRSSITASCTYKGLIILFVAA